MKKKILFNQPVLLKTKSGTLAKKFIPSYLNIYTICILISLSLLFCKKNDLQSEYKTYTISRGQHYSKRSGRILLKTEVKFTAIFDSTAIYKTKSSGNQDATNKLYGFSDCSEAHHINSARFGWCWHEGHLKINVYC